MFSFRSINSRSSKMQRLLRIVPQPCVSLLHIGYYVTFRMQGLQMILYESAIRLRTWLTWPQAYHQQVVRICRKSTERAAEFYHNSYRTVILPYYGKRQVGPSAIKHLQTDLSDLLWLRAWGGRRAEEWHTLRTIGVVESQCQPCLSSLNREEASEVTRFQHATPCVTVSWLWILW
jgi:hypothetical protein